MTDNKIILKTTTKTGKTLTFRYPTIGDLQILTDFVNKVSKEKTFIDLQGEKVKIEDEKKWLELTLEKIKNKEKVAIIAFVNDKLAGFSDIELDTFANKHNGIFTITIDRDYRGNGIGKALMKLVISKAKKNIEGLKLIVLDCFASNIVAKKLYRKMGFVKYGCLPDGFKRRGKYDDQVFMYKEI